MSLPSTRESTFDEAPTAEKSESLTPPLPQGAQWSYIFMYTLGPLRAGAFIAQMQSEIAFGSDMNQQDEEEEEEDAEDPWMSPQWLAYTAERRLAINLELLTLYLENAIQTVACLRPRGIVVQVDPHRYKSNPSRYDFDAALTTVFDMLSQRIWPDITVTGFHITVKKAAQVRSHDDAVYGVEGCL
eukprot:Protomagalhaensia_sp_Gyna_25__3295@NODE_2992_length_786_cov_338_278447_g2499_i0_p1_GENE_NODE_2992_length_786_cov_338_278447_g2499_i0NODE_2992_length_786_cov_338_278447_g2499_i0_p1_ORF_typecomplete_len186_score31_81_NODE_2992_length_786_cov_338_278447_g2499_i068625